MIKFEGGGLGGWGGVFRRGGLAVDKRANRGAWGKGGELGDSEPSKTKPDVRLSTVAKWGVLR